MQKIVKFTDDKYICPQKAIRKFRSAKKLCTRYTYMELQVSGRLLWLCTI